LAIGSAIAGAAFGSEVSTEGVTGTKAAGASIAAAAISTLSIPKLEKAFWRCDYAATKVFVGSITAAECSALTEELKRSRFGDDFSAMLKWWQQNKEFEHAALDRAKRD
jgi:hypothetical protein